MIALKIAQRELTAAWRERLHGFRILMLCLIFGIASISAIGSLRGAIDAGLNSNGRVFLGGDAEIELTYRQANAQEVAWMTGQSLAQSQIIDFRSMAVAPATNKRLLTQIKAVDSAYPLVGAVTLSDDLSLPEAFAGRDGLPGAILAPALLRVSRSTWVIRCSLGKRILSSWRPSSKSLTILEISHWDRAALS